MFKSNEAGVGLYRLVSGTYANSAAREC